MRPVTTYRLEPADLATRFTRTVEMPLDGPMRLLAPLMRRNMQARNRRFVENLKRLVEA
jgi:hypothetical protein